MPPYTTLRTFIEAISTGKTNITRSLEKATNDPARRAALATAIAAKDAFNHPISREIHDALIQAGMTQPEVDHIQRWPDDQKERIRSRLVDVWGQNKSIYFSWEIHSGPEPVTEITTDSSGDSFVAFRSPRAGVRITSSLNLGNIQVDV